MSDSCPDCGFTLRTPDRCRCGWHKPQLHTAAAQAIDIQAIKESAVRRANAEVPEHIRSMSVDEMRAYVRTVLPNMIEKMRVKR